MTALTLVLVEAAALLVAARATGAPAVPAVLFAIVTVVAFYYNDLYDLRTVSSLPRYVARLPRALAMALLPVAGLHVVVPQLGGGGSTLAWTLLASLALVLGIRAAAYRLVRNRAFVDRVLILGTGPMARKVIQEIQARPHCGYAIVGVADNPVVVDARTVHFRWLGGLHALSSIIAEVRPRRIVVALADRRGRLPVRQLMESRVLSGIAVEDAADVYERLTGKIAIESLSPSSFVFSQDFFKPRLGLFLGHAVSRLVAAVALVLLLPVLAVIGLAIKLDSEGPVFFVHDRVGLRGRPFRLVKFRTMHPPSGRRSEWVHDNHDRITRVGRWLRTFRLDELPQFVNVLRGELNLVGPRPHPASNFELFMDTIPHYWLRFAVRPGITGWAQIRYGYANNLEEETEKMRYDLYYIKHMSQWFDLRILFDTVKTVACGRGSAAATTRRSPAVEALRQSQFDPAA